MTDALLAETDQQEALSFAYAHAIAAGAGYSTSRMDFDRDSIDVAFNAGGAMRPRIEAQLKATTNLLQRKYRFPLSIKNYNDLRLPTQTPRILVVLDMPKDKTKWLAVSLKQLVLRRAAYWASLLGQPETENTSSVTVTIPAEQRFDVESLKTLMDQSRHGTLG